MTPKQEKFAAGVASGMTQAAAYRRAFPNAVKWKDTSVHTRASQLAADALVRQRIEEIRQKAAREAEVDAAWLLKRLVQAADADLADLHAEDGGLKPVSEWPEVWRRTLVQGLETVTKGNDMHGFAEILKVKMADRLKVLEMIGRHVTVGAFRDQVAVTGKDGGPVQVDVSGMSTEALRELLEARKRAGQ
jgi:phage terminase small subunit